MFILRGKESYTRSAYKTSMEESKEPLDLEKEKERRALRLALPSRRKRSKSNIKELSELQPRKNFAWI